MAFYSPSIFRDTGMAPAWGSGKPPTFHSGVNPNYVPDPRSAQNQVGPLAGMGLKAPAMGNAGVAPGLLGGGGVPGMAQGMRAFRPPLSAYGNYRNYGMQFPSLGMDSGLWPDRRVAGILEGLQYRGFNRRFNRRSF